VGKVEVEVGSVRRTVIIEQRKDMVQIIREALDEVVDSLDAIPGEVWHKAH